MSDTTNTTSLRERITREADAHDYFAANPDLRMTTGDHAKRAENLRAIAALQSQQVASADRGEAVCFRFQLQTGEWSRWLSMEDLTHYGPDGNLVDGPHPDWKRVEYAYAVTPPSPAESADPTTSRVMPTPSTHPDDVSKTDANIDMTAEAAAPSGVSDAMVDSAARALCQRFAAECGGDAPDAWAKLSQHFKDDARAALEASQPQPGRVEGMVLVPVEPTKAMLAAISVGESSMRRQWYAAMLAAAPTAGGQEAK